jgi:hypothetical protein
MAGMINSRATLTQAENIGEKHHDLERINMTYDRNSAAP